MFHRGSDEHAELQKRTKTLLQKAFYKYARLYLVARKGYKDARSFNRMVKEDQDLFEDVPSVSIKSDFSNPTENYKTLKQIDDKDFEDQTFATNDARSNVQALEGFAILILEIFGAILGLSLGAIGQIQAGFIFDI